jgi:hypothetical protein
MIYHSKTEAAASGETGISWQRLRNCAHWLLTINISPDHGRKSGGLLNAAYPQSKAVVDDFGTLVCVTPWR